MKLQALAHAIGARLLGDGDLQVTRVRAVDEAGDGDLGFAAAARELKDAFVTKATAVLVDEAFAAEHAHELPCATLAASPASLALAKAIDLLHPVTSSPSSSLVHSTAFVASTARLGPGTRVNAMAVVCEDVRVGAGCVIGAGAVLVAGVTLGDRVRVGPGCVVGDEGFVYAPADDAGAAENVVVRHVASVVLEDDVELGANVCVDRGALRDTRVGRGTKVDNLVQIGHDVVIGENAVIIAQVGIAGDARIGDGAVLAGQAGVKERVTIGKRARIGGQAGVTKSVPDGAAVSGMPAIPHMTWLRAMSRLQHLEALEKRVRALEQALKEKP